MNWIARRVMNVMMGSFVGSGLGIDEAGRIELPDGLTPTRVHRFVDLVTGETHASPREALHGLFRRVGVDADTVELLDRILHDGGDVDLAAVARHGAALTAALPRLRRIPERFQSFLVDELRIADPACDTLEKAAVSTRERAAARLGCPADWDAILARPEGVAAITRPWRERRA